jgi:DNA-binding transcriptional ArsR family regulator
MQMLENEQRHEIRRQSPVSSEIPWGDVTVQLARAKDLLSVKILEKIYVNPGGPCVAVILGRQLKPQVAAITIRRHLRKLEQLGLIKLIGKSPVSVYPVPGISASHIQRLRTLVLGYVIGDSHGYSDRD